MSKTKQRRGARGRGRLFKKVGAKQVPADSTAQGNYYLTYYVNGKRVTVALRDADDKPITKREAAEGERKRILAPYAAGDDLDALQTVRARLADAEIRQAEAEAEANPPPKLDAIWERFLESPGRPDSGRATLRGYHFRWKRFAAWLNTNHKDVVHLHQITSAHAAAYAKDLAAAKVSASTYNQHRNLLRMVWRVLADECRLVVNPWDDIHPRKLTPLANRKHALSQAQYENLLSAVGSNPDLRDLFTLLAWTGLRLADAVLMKWGSVDFSRRVISLAPMKTARRQGKLVHIPIFPVAEEVLNRRQSGTIINPKGYVLPALAARYERDASGVSKAITRAFERAGISTTEERADRDRGVVIYGAHSLRHFFVTEAASAGMPAAMIKSITGHATDAMLEHYQQMGADLAAELASRIQGKEKAKELPAPAGTKKDTAKRPPLPDWARELVESLTAENLAEGKKELLAG